MSSPGFLGGIEYGEWLGEEQETGTLRKVYAGKEEGPSKLVLHNWKTLKNRRDLTDLRLLGYSDKIQISMKWDLERAEPSLSSVWHEQRTLQCRRKGPGTRPPQGPASSDLLLPTCSLLLNFPHKLSWFASPQWGADVLLVAGYTEPKFPLWGSKLCWRFNPQRLAQRVLLIYFLSLLIL